MSNRSVRVDLPDEVWKVIDIQFKPLSDETDSEILTNIIKNHLAEHAYYQDLDSLTRGQGIKGYLDIQEYKIMSIVDILEKKGLATCEEWEQIMLEKIMR